MVHAWPLFHAATQGAQVIAEAGEWMKAIAMELESRPAKRRAGVQLIVTAIQPLSHSRREVALWP
jgi:hypothetical protein